MHQLLPPTYRDVWLEWRDSEQQRQEESRTAANKPRDQFISRLLTRLKQQQIQSNGQSQGQGFGSQGQLGAGDEEPEESWENLAGLDIGGGEESEEKGEKRVRERGYEASRELLRKLKKSPLAHRLQVNTLKLFHVVQ